MTEVKNAKQISDVVWEIPPSYKAGMNVPARIYATKKLLEAMDAGVIEQVTNVAMLPGIVKYSYAMADAHWGYGFPIGGVAAFDLEKGVISPGGIGFDINCGMRLVRTNLRLFGGQTEDQGARGPPLPPRPHRGGRKGHRQGEPVAVRGGHEVGSQVVRRERLRLGRRRLEGRGRGVHQGREPLQGQPAGLQQGDKPARHARLGQPLLRGAGGRPGALLRREDGKAVRARPRRPGRRHGALREQGLRPPGRRPTTSGSSTPR